MAGGFALGNERVGKVSQLPHVEDLSPSAWTADVGPSTPISPNQRGVLDFRRFKDQISRRAGGDEKTFKSVGKVYLVFHSAGKTGPETLDDVLVVPEFRCVLGLKAWDRVGKTFKGGGGRIP